MKKNNKKEGRKSILRRYLRTSNVLIISFLIVLFGTVILDYIFVLYFNSRAIEKEKESVRLEMEAVRNRIEDELGKNLYILYGMASYISVRSDISHKEFENLAKRLLKQSNSLSNIAAAPDFIIKYVYPLKKHKRIIGLNYRKNKMQWPEAKAARDNKSMTIAGPIKLVQGGIGLVARVPVFIDKDRKFWGLISALFDFDTLVEKTGLNKKNSSINFALKGRHSKGVSGEVFLGDPKLYDREINSIKTKVALPNGYWLMAGYPKDGWLGNKKNTWYIHIFFIISGIILFLTISRLLFARISIEDSAYQFNAMSKASHDALIIIDSYDNISLWNPAAERMFNFTEEEMTGKKMHEVIAMKEDKEKAYKGLNHFRKTGSGPILRKVREALAKRKGGKVFPVELSVASFKIRGKWFAVGSIRDITERKEYEKKLTKLATIDSLTGLCNRRYFLELSEKEFDRITRYKRDLGLLMMDVDHFKSVNDNFGHDTGDLVLREVSKSILNTIRSSDIAGRLGGEEFSVLLPETDINSALTIAERIRKGIESLVFPDHENLSVTISIGLSCFKGQSMLSEILKEADKCLYRAKKEGRNRVVS